jgi:uncharacterized protein YgiM (DUF1202 family)
LYNEILFASYQNQNALHKKSNPIGELQIPPRKAIPTNSSCSATISAEGASMAKYVVTTSALRLRSGPGTNYSTIGMLYKNNVVQGSELQGDWIHVTTSDDKTGWSHRAYLELVNETPPPTSGAAYRVDAATLNLRQ